MRLILHTLLLFASIIAASACSAFAQEAVYLIRHGEKELRGDDPALTDAGRIRASAWSEMLSNAKIDAVFTSEAKRTRETGRIIADAMGLQATALPASGVSALVDLLQFDHDEGRVLVVGHAETLPGIIRALGTETDITISQDDFANLFILLRPGSDDPNFVHLRMAAIETGG